MYVIQTIVLQSKASQFFSMAIAWLKTDWTKTYIKAPFDLVTVFKLMVFTVRIATMVYRFIAKYYLNLFIYNKASFGDSQALLF